MGHGRPTVLTDDQVREVRRLRALPRDQRPLYKELAHRYGVCVSPVRAAAIGETHGDIDVPPVGLTFMPQRR
jgi:hypothetical protein